MTVQQTCEYLKGQDDFLILCHQSPDGDTLGSGFALYYTLRALGKRARVACSDPIPSQFDFLLPQEMPDFTPRCVVAVDIADTQLLGSGLSRWENQVDLCIDHHPSNKLYAKQTLLRGSAAATAEIMIEIICGLGVQPDSQIADCIYTGLCTDTGCFQYSNVTSYTLRTAADMIDRGADAYRINRRMFSTKSKARIAMEREVLDSLVYAMDGKIAVIAVTGEMLARTGAEESELDGLSSIPREIEGVQVGVTLREKADGFKVSLRTVEKIDASHICAVFGGGGHARAAGCFISGSLEQCRRKIIQATKAACEEAGL
ncbi:MAG: DHH family phosphoesterase [Oscillospiraceae bacterium]|nr:DHH family phosphoesterase [Oscillospiraceae bacterium]